MADNRRYNNGYYNNSYMPYEPQFHYGNNRYQDINKGTWNNFENESYNSNANSKQAVFRDSRYNGQRRMKANYNNYYTGNWNERGNNRVQPSRRPYNNQQVARSNNRNASRQSANWQQGNSRYRGNNSYNNYSRGRYNNRYANMDYGRDFYDDYDDFYGGRFSKQQKPSKFMFLISVIVFISCAVYLGNYIYHSKQVQSKQADLTDRIDNISDDMSGTNNRYETIQKEYPNLVGRLLFHNYNDVIDLPVMQTKDIPLYYLYRDQDGKDSNWGTPFIDYRCDVGKPTSNFVVYAHNMKDLTQFGSLKNYKDESYWKKYPTVEFETMYEGRCQYDVVASFYTQIYDESVKDVFKYYEFFDAKNEKEYDDFITNVKKEAQYDTGITPKFGEQLLTMSTCDYTQKVKEGRFVVVARKGKTSEHK